MKDVYDKLLDYQKPHLNNVINTLLDHKRGLDLSDTGTGKTYCNVAASILLNKKLFIICPKSVIMSWLDVIEYFGADYYGVANYELLRNCKYMYKGEKIVCPYIERIEYEKPSTDPHNHEPKKVVQYFWKDLPQDILFIFDEAHRCKNSRTLNYKMLKALNAQDINIMLLSATLSDKIENFKLAGLVLKLYNRTRNYKTWLTKITRGTNSIKAIHNLIFPQYASRMKIADLKNVFQNNNIHSNCYEMECAKEIQEMYDVIEEETKRLKQLEDNSGCELARILYARMRIEQLKIPTFIKLAKEQLNKGNSVTIFVNFTNTLLTLKDELNTECVIYGEQTMDDRNANIMSFNNDKERVIICNIRSGGVGISLHDTKGVYPRISIISPSFSAQDIIQVLGRIHRANGKSEVNQYIVYCAKTVEEKICESMSEKINNIAHLNDGEVTQNYQIKGMNVDLNEKGSYSQMFTHQDKKKLSEENKIKYTELIKKREEILTNIEQLRTTLRNVDDQITKLFL